MFFPAFYLIIMSVFLSVTFCIFVDVAVSFGVQFSNLPTFIELSYTTYSCV